MLYEFPKYAKYFTVRAKASSPTEIKAAGRQYSISFYKER